jgi:hypothetical protein
MNSIGSQDFFLKLLYATGLLIMESSKVNLVSANKVFDSLSPSGIKSEALSHSFPREMFTFVPTMAYTPLFLVSRGLGNPSRWITCRAFCPPSLGIYRVPYDMI